MAKTMGLIQCTLDTIQVGDQVAWMPQRPIQEHGISQSVLEFGFISGAPTPAGIPVRLWEHDEYHHYVAPYPYDSFDRFITISDLYKWHSIPDHYVTDALIEMQGD